MVSEYGHQCVPFVFCPGDKYTVSLSEHLRGERQADH